MQPTWQKCQGDVWGPLMNVDLSHAHFDNMEGVYIIWQGSGPVVRVGQGIIRDRLAAHRRDTAITAYPNLYVTWAPIFVTYRDGVERYLANALAPRVGDAFPDVNPIQVALPLWE
ncbi:hypothetical protein AUJ77_01905 [Candidatus Nomurabacteria bacterium CG1_02_43_90]|uniref:GIY-YIG domain-containing protein n=1 Tax=Candidatus Nomurabacteria bacterium CG1_02_43_90 TaxID=1805281 RepID=A0A1J4V459_9BACT|nr:MAG: hypothetical protein AUJ77_01905 [Candidatus Nomurabacteria bacterium CG1_02_43_90]